MSEISEEEAKKLVIETGSVTETDITGISRIRHRFGDVDPICYSIQVKQGSGNGFIVRSDDGTIYDALEFWNGVIDHKQIMRDIFWPENVP